jgi:hypothetical protein
MILILTSPDDLHADHVEPMLDARGLAYLRFDPAQYPHAAELSMAYGPSGATRQLLRVGGREVDLSTITAVWNRRPGLPRAAPEITDAKVRELVAGESDAMVRDLWRSLDCAWLPAPPAVLREANRKAAQLRLAGALGFELPPTLVSNSPDDVIEFHRQHGGRIVSKLLGAAFMSSSFGNEMVRYTEQVSHRDLANLEAIRLCPMIFQAYVEKRIELRITVVGRRVMACEIHSQASHHTRHDWRRYDDAATPHYVHALPAAIERRCLALTERMGLSYGAIDMIVTPDGRYVFLEINPNGQYLWIEQQTGLPISDAIVEQLAAGTEVRAALGGAS